MLINQRSEKSAKNLVSMGWYLLLAFYLVVLAFISTLRTEE
jgi:hypothetical protein